MRYGTIFTINLCACAQKDAEDGGSTTDRPIENSGTKPHGEAADDLGKG
jgi:hypothetical protein